MLWYRLRLRFDDPSFALGIAYGCDLTIHHLLLISFTVAILRSIICSWYCLRLRFDDPSFALGQALDGSVGNNSRSIIISATADPAVAGVVTRRIDGFLCFVRAAKYFVSNAEIRD